MLNDHGADLNLADNNKQAPLHYSVKSGSIDGARCLLDLGADLEIRDNQGFTPFAKAVQQNEAGLVQLFLSRGTRVDGLTQDGQSTLHLAALYAGIVIMRLMINMDHGGLQSDARDGIGDTPSDCFRKQRDQVFVGLRDSLMDERAAFEELMKSVVKDGLRDGESRSLGGDESAECDDGESDFSEYFDCEEESQQAHTVPQITIS